MNREKIFYNAVARALEGNPGNLRKIRKRCGELIHPWETVYGLLVKQNSHPPDPETEWERLERHGIRLIFADDADFPPLLREMHNPPIAIFTRGVISKENELGSAGRTISIVGTRRALPEGKKAAKTFAYELANSGFTISSGMALGIDAAAHEGCLQAGGQTIAVLAGGLDKLYPAENEQLGRRILAEGGAIISEYPLGEPPYPDRFLERNRIVCGLSRGVLVLECPARSGSLATAAYAREQNRDLFVIPGPITHPNFTGSHQLIRQGAELITCVEEILKAYGIPSEEKAAKAITNANRGEKQVLQALRELSAPADVDKIVEITRLEPRIASRALSFLLLKQLIKETDAGYIIE